MPMVGMSAPFILSRNGRKVRNPIRVALSVIAMASNSQNPRALGAAVAIGGWLEAALDIPR